MQTEKKIYIGLAILIALAALLYMQSGRSKQETASHAGAAASANRPTMKITAEDADKVTKLVVKNADKGEVVLEKRDDKWMVTKPVESPANQQNVKGAIDSLKEIKVTDAINDTPQAAEVYKDYQLDDAKAVHVSAYKGNDVLIDAFFGKSGSRGQMARLASTPGVWVVSGYSSYQFAREVKNWRDTEVLKFEDANVVSLAIDNEEGSYSFSKNGETWSGTFKKNPIARFDPEKVKDMLRAYKGLNAEDFGDGKSDSDTGLDKPVATVTVTLKDDAGTHKVLFGKTSSGSSRYARKDSSSTVYVIGSWASDWAVAKVEKFQKPEEKKDAGADAK